MTTPERSIEDKAVTDFFKKVNVHLKSSPHGRCAVESALVETLQTERQKREEAVEAKAIEVREEEANEYNKIIEREVEKEKQKTINYLKWVKDSAKSFKGDFAIQQVIDHLETLTQPNN